MTKSLCVALLALLDATLVLSGRSCGTSHLLTKTHACLPDVERANSSMIDLTSIPVTNELHRILNEPVQPEKVPMALQILEAACMALRSETDNTTAIYDGSVISVNGSNPGTAKRAMYLDRILALAGSSHDLEWESSFLFQHARNHLTLRKAHKPSRPSPLDIVSCFTLASVMLSLTKNPDHLAAGLFLR